MKQKKDVTDRLYDAVAAWAKSKGGNIVVIGGIETQQWGADPARFVIGIKCLGTAPKRPR